MIFGLLPLVLLAAETGGQTLSPPLPPTDAAEEFQVQTVLSGLQNPAGLAVRPSRQTEGPFQLLLAESGAGRVLQLSTADPENYREVITGFPVNRLTKRLPYKIGPLALALLTRSSSPQAHCKLIVGDSGRPAGNDLVSVYKLAPDGQALDAGQVDHSQGPLRNSPGAESGNVNFFGIVKSSEMVYLAVGGDDGEGVILKGGIQANRLAYLQPFAGKHATGGRASTGIAVPPPPRPTFLVVAETGTWDLPADSTLTFYVPSTGESVMSLPVGLHDMIALAYSPSGRLYALDFAWADEQAGGVFRLDDVRVDGQQACQAVRIASLIRPLGLAFTPDGTLYVTALGPGENDSQGTLVKITGNL